MDRLDIVAPLAATDALAVATHAAVKADLRVNAVGLVESGAGTSEKAP